MIPHSHQAICKTKQLCHNETSEHSSPKHAGMPKPVSHSSHIQCLSSSPFGNLLLVFEYKHFTFLYTAILFPHLKPIALISMSSQMLLFFSIWNTLYSRPPDKLFLQGSVQMWPLCWKWSWYTQADLGSPASMILNLAFPLE